MYKFFNILFPSVITFEFTVANGSIVNLSFNSSMKICDFIKDVNEKAYISFNIPNSKNLDIVEINKNSAYGIPLDPNDETTLCEKYADNYKQISFFISFNSSF